MNRGVCRTWSWTAGPVVALFATAAIAVDLEPGDLVVASQGSSAVVHVDPVSGVQTLITSGNLITSPVSVVVDAQGRIFVGDSNSGLIIEVDPATGGQTQISAGALPIFGLAGLSLDGNGDLVLTNGNDWLLRVDRASGTEQVLSSFGSSSVLRDVEVEEDGMILVVDANADSLIRVDPTTGAQSTVWTNANGSSFPYALAPDGAGSIFVSDPSVPAVYRIDTSTGAESVISTDPQAIGFAGMDSNDAGVLYWANGNINGISKIDSVSGAVGILTTDGLLGGPSDVAVVPSPACDPTPAPACAAAGSGSLSIKKLSDSSSDSLKWKLKKGTFPVADFGAPDIGTGLALCVYADGRLAMSRSIDAAGACDGNACWRALGAKGFKYKNRNGNGAGISGVVLKEGTGNASILVKGRGANLSPSLPLDVGTGGALLQLIRFDSSECWESSFPTFLNNDSESFKAKF